MAKGELPDLHRGKKECLKILYKDTNNGKTCCMTIDTERFMFKKAFNGATERYIGWYEDIQIVESNVVCHELLLGDVIEEADSVTKLDATTALTDAIVLGKVTKKNGTLLYYVFMKVVMDNVDTKGVGSFTVHRLVSPRRNDAITCHVNKQLQESKQQNFFESPSALIINNEEVYFHRANSDYGHCLVMSGRSRCRTHQAVYRTWDSKFNAVISKPSYNETTVKTSHNISITLSKEHEDALAVTVGGLELPKNEILYSLKRKRKVKGGGNKNVVRLPSGNSKTEGVKNFHPQDKELEILTKGAASNAFQKAISLYDLCKAIKDIMAGMSLFIQGMLAVCLFSNTKWTVAEPIPYDKSKVQYKHQSTMDVDQASLDVVDINRAVVEHGIVNRGFSTNYDFLDYHYTNFIDQVRLNSSLFRIPYH